MLNLAQGSYQLAQPAVDRLLAQNPDNVMALMAQARLQFIRRAPDAALATYRKLLSVAPDMKPDPRVGLGLCSWLLGDKVLAVKAWERSLERVGHSSLDRTNSSGSWLYLGSAAARHRRPQHIQRRFRVRRRPIHCRYTCSRRPPKGLYQEQQDGSCRPRLGRCFVGTRKHCTGA